MSRPTAEIARHTLTYGFGFVVGGIARLLLIPIIARTLSPDEYGVYALLLATLLFLQIVFDLGFAEALIRFHHEDEAPKERGRLRSLLFALLPLIDILLVVPLLFARDFVSELLFATPTYGPLVALAVMAAFFGTQLQLYLGHLRAEDRSGQFVVLMALRGSVALGATLILVFGLNMGVTGFLLGQLAAPAVVTFLVIPRLLLRVGLDFGQARQRLRPILHFGLPLMPSALGMWALSHLDSYLLRAFADLDAVGVYRFAAEVCMPISLLLTSFNLAWPSFAFARARTAAGAQELAAVFRHMFAVLAWASLGLAALRHEIFELLGAEAFAASAPLIPLWVLATCLFGAAMVFGTGLRIARDTRRLPLYVLVAIILNAGLAILAIPLFGVVGCAAAKVLTLFVLAMLVLRESNRHFPIPFELGKLATILGVGAFLLLITDAYGDLPLLTGTVARGATVLLFPLLLILMGVFSRAEVEALPSLLRR